MADKIAQIGISEIAHTLKIRKNNNQSIVLFLGSRAGALFRSQSFYKIMEGYSNPNFSLLPSHKQFVECYKLLKQGRFNDREAYNILTLALRDTVNTEANICLAELVKQNLFDVILSTNLDTFLEDAFKETGMKEQYDFDVFIPDRDFSLHNLIYSDKRLSCKVIKAFSDLTSRAYSVAKRDFYLDSIQGLKGLLESILARDVLIIGFDPIWDEEILRTFPIGGNGILWLLAEEGISNRHPLALLGKRGRQVKYITGQIGGSEEFIKALYRYFYERSSNPKEHDNLVEQGLPLHNHYSHQDHHTQLDHNQMSNQHEGAMPHRLRVFLCHASEDKPIVRSLSKKLADHDIDTWLDENSLLGGQQWEEEITNAVQEVDVIIICLSQTSIRKIGFVQKEIKMALNIADRQPERTIFIIPLKLEECDLPNRLKHLHAVNYGSKDGFDQLMRSINHKRSQ